MATSTPLQPQGGIRHKTVAEQTGSVIGEGMPAVWKAAPAVEPPRQQQAPAGRTGRKEKRTLEEGAVDYNHLVIEMKVERDRAKVE